MSEDFAQLGYLPRLMLRLTLGAANLPESLQQRHAGYVLSRQNEDGGWAGREGGSDLYYTSFALRSLAILGLLHGQVATKVSEFLHSRLSSHETVVDLLSLVYSARLVEASCGIDPLKNLPAGWSDRLSALLETYFREDGGYSKSHEGLTGSTYQTFLVLLCLELIGEPIPHLDANYGFLSRQRQSDGGFLEIRVAKRSGTNPTAAAIGGLQVLNKLDEHTGVTAAEFLADRQSDEGGFVANTRIPLPDLLSSFTACVTLADLEHMDFISSDAVRTYALGMEQPDGGFRGFEFDPADDIEYTFYGLGLLALLEEQRVP